jgi:ribose transport system ATP-binding protein/rhamnose transport system ATP-binding protein
VTGVRTILETSQDELIHLEVGRELSFENIHREIDPNNPIVLEVEHLSAFPVVDATLNVRAGEIVCLAGLVGAGRTALCEAIFGLRPIESGVIRIDGNELTPKHPYDAMNANIGMVPEDRREAGLFLEMSIAANIAATNLKEISNGALIQNHRINELADEAIDMLNIISPSINREVMFLSGGNQQKVLLAKWLARRPEILIVDEPTRGVDVGAKSDLYKILRDLANRDVGLLVVSSEMPEVLALADRIIVMSDGKTVGEMTADEASEEKILLLATPVGVTKRGEQI